MLLSENFDLFALLWDLKNHPQLSVTDFDVAGAVN
ncbi:MAG: hypothetical protein Nk1A_8190 [Endomicrobiia bacterium]|nr:MAG: hypothetical protein Nk1A_8190 [Endomicrobiia bacterium]